jgi:Holliday junction resolvase RusA-like endonuclease
MITLTLPLKVMTAKKGRKSGKPKFFILNLNNYRNAHFQVLNKAKREYAELVKQEVQRLGLEPVAFAGKIKLVFTYFHNDFERVDTSNICSIVDKFTCDALTDFGLWPDDDARTIISTRYRFGGVDAINPRVELKITEQALMQ